MIFSDKKFAPLFWTQFFGALNDNLYKNALVVLVAYKGVEVFGLSTSSLVAFASGLFILPFVLFSPLAGQICDKFEKSSVVKATKWWELIIMAIGAVGYFTDNYVLLLFVLFLMGMQSTFFGPLKYSMIPELVPPGKLVSGNAYVESGTFIAILIGMTAGGAAANFENAAMIISSGIVGMAVLGLATSYKVVKVPSGDPNLKINYNPIPTFAELWRIMREKTAIFNSVMAISWFWFIGAAILTILPIYCKDILRVDALVTTFFLALFTVGIGVGSFACAQMSQGRVELGLVPPSALGLTVFLADLSSIGPSWSLGDGELLDFYAFWSQPETIRITADFLLMSVCAGIFILPLYTLLQERSDESKRSRIIAGLNVVNSVFMVVSSVIIMGFYAIDLGPREIYLIFAVLNVIAAIYIYFVVPEFTLRFYSWLFSKIFYRVQVHGVDNIPETGGVLLAGNHVSFIDWLILAGACRRPPRFVLYYKFFDVPVLKWIMRQARVIPIAGALEDPARLRSAMAEVSQALKNGDCVFVFPEGGLTNDGAVRPFKPGILKMLEAVPVPVVPIALKGMWGSIYSRHKHRGSRWRKGLRRRVAVEFGRPMSPVGFRLDALEAEVKKMLASSPQNH